MRLLLTAALLAGSALAAPSAQAATCIGNCGTVENIFTGSVTPAPTNFGKYDWVSTNGGVSGAAQIPGFSDDATNGSELISDPFFAAAGQTISFWFNYVTSDGSGFADYAFAQLNNTSTSSVTNLFTARTRPSGSIVPGFNLPDVEATLSPATVPIIPGGPIWAPLGSDSGLCYSGGCGYTGWIQSDFTVVEAGTYELRFGAANWSDTAFDSGLAFSGLVLDGNTIGDGTSFDSPLLPTEIGPNGEFEFEFEATPQSNGNGGFLPFNVVIDPVIAIGYTFSSNVPILTAEWENLGDSQYLISYFDGVSNIDTLFTPGLGNIFSFGAGVLGFTVSGIDEALMIDPTDTTAFKTKLGLSISQTTTVNITQTPITKFVPGTGAVPEPATWAMMILGFGLIGSAMRRAKKVSTRVSFA